VERDPSAVVVTVLIEGGGLAASVQCQAYQQRPQQLCGIDRHSHAAAHDELHHGEGAVRVRALRSVYQPGGCVAVPQRDCSQHT
jgi:hypothetical protein